MFLYALQQFPVIFLSCFVKVYCWLIFLFGVSVKSQNICSRSINLKSRRERKQQHCIPFWMSHWKSKTITLLFIMQVLEEICNRFMFITSELRFLHWWKVGVAWLYFIPLIMGQLIITWSRKHRTRKEQFIIKWIPVQSPAAVSSKRWVDSVPRSCCYSIE